MTKSNGTKKNVTGKKPKSLRVLIAEDDPAVRGALAQLIHSEPTFDLVGVAADALEAIELSAAEQPDVVVVDVRMPGGGGEAAAKGIRLHSPDSKVIALSGHDDRATVLEMLQAGVVGYLVKGGAVEEIIEAIKRAPDGQGSLSSGVTSHVIRELAGQLSLRSRNGERRRLREMRIRHAVRVTTAFTIIYQPIVALSGSAIVGAEALARFPGPPRRSPDVWFAEAKDVGLGVALELAAARKALKALAHLPSNVYLTVNVSPTTLANSQFHELVSEVGGSHVVAEITEHALVQDYDRLAGAVGKLRSLGMRLAVDDAGAGFASLRHILNLDPELIKLDLTLVRNIHLDRSRQALAAGLISFAQRSGATIIAEGVESALEADMLVELGVAYGQGYFLGRPAPLPLAGRAANEQIALSPLH